MQLETEDDRRPSRGKRLTDIELDLAGSRGARALCRLFLRGALALGVGVTSNSSVGHGDVSIVGSKEQVPILMVSMD